MSLQDKLHKLSDIDISMSEILQNAKLKNNGVLSEDERRQFDKADEEYDKLYATLSTEEKVEMIQGTGTRQTEPDSIGDPGIKMTTSPHITNAIPTTGGKKYADLFGSKLSNGGFHSAEDFFATIAGGRSDERLQQLAHSEGTPSSGGFFVPEQFAAAMLDAALESEIVRPRAQVESMTSETKSIAGFESTDNSGGSLYGGFSANWTEESGSITEETGVIRKIKLEARKLALFTKSSNELLEDGTSFESQLLNALTSAAAWHLDYSFLRGTGAGQPRGVLNDLALISVAKETSQAAATILYENLTKMFARLHAASVSNSIWIANPTCIPQLLQLSIAVGTGGSFIPAVTESGGEFHLLTRPVLFTEKLPALGTVGDIILADFSQYTIGLRKEFLIESSAHVGFQTDEMTWRGIIRADGQGRWKSAFTPANGDSQSWCVSLATRA